MQDTMGGDPPDADNTGDDNGLVRCEITGKMVSPDDAVEFQGRLVSAEGKEILLERLRNNEGRGPAGEPRRPSFWRRLLCSLLDTAILGVILGALVAVLDLPDSSIFDDDFAVRGYPGFLLRVACTFFYAAYMHGKYGQTLGKMIGGYRVANRDGTAITWPTAFVRAFWSDGYDLAFSIVVVLRPDLEWIWLFSLLYGLVNCLALVADTGYNRALHDRLAGTRVVMNR